MYRRSTWIDIIHAIQSLNDKGDIAFKDQFQRLYALESWSLEGSGVFSVKSSRNLIDDKFLPKDDVPTRSNLSLRGVDIPTINCPICNLVVESSHIFSSCLVARKVWRIFLLWWELDDAVFHSYNEWLLWLVSIRMPKQLKEFLEVLVEQLKYLKKKQSTPGPSLVLPFIGNAISLVRNPTEFWKVQADNARKSNTGFSANYIIGKFIVFIRDTDLSHKIFANVRPDAFHLI
ncbi:hypothetical protein Tco_1297411, partial [Tanacetum coccineum]